MNEDTGVHAIRDWMDARLEPLSNIPHHHRMRRYPPRESSAICLC
jgi:hypothetical protein